ncbi:MAG: 50S ribosomal protein L30e [Candidatus Hadarchaeales archaeon]
MKAGRELKELISGGKAAVGARTVLRSLKRGEAKLVIVASNCREDVLMDIQHHARIARVPVETFEGDSSALGLACGKPFAVNALAVLGEAGAPERG